jgi:hypothetical protein
VGVSYALAVVLFSKTITGAYYQNVLSYLKLELGAGRGASFAPYCAAGKYDEVLAVLHISGPPCFE